MSIKFNQGKLYGWGIGISILTIAILLIFPSTGFAIAKLEIGQAIQGKYIVVLDRNASAGNASQVAKDHSLGIRHSYSFAFSGFSAAVPAGRLNALRNDPRVLSVTQDYVMGIAAPPCGTPRGGPCPTEEPTPDPTEEPTPDPTEEPTPDPGGSQVIPTGVLRINANLSSTLAGNGSGSVNVDVAVLDTGVDIDHPDLNVVGGFNCTGGQSSKYNDGHGHGTHVSGTIGAIDNGSGVVGVAPGARIWGIKVLNNGGLGSLSEIICGIDWVTANASTIEVANMSLGGRGSDDGLSCA
ncbi:MAG: S8 family serine peptidase, partial [Chloroflexota bacterium]